MSKFKDLTGLRFGRLLVLEKHSTDKYGRTIWSVQCECEKIITTLGDALKNGFTKSCGCLRRDLVIQNNKNRALPNGESCFNMLFKNYKNEAKSREISFELSEDRFRELTKGFCFYCGREPSQKIELPGRNGAYVYNGIDRWNNDIGYTESNSVTCCGTCNWMKHAQSAPNFIQACQKVSDHQSKRLGESAAH